MTDSEKIAMLEKRVRILENMLIKYVSPEEIESQILQETDDSPVFRCDFSDKNDELVKKWRICNAEKSYSDRGIVFKSILLEKILGFLYNPMIVNHNMNIPTEKIKYVHVRLKSNVDASKNCFITVYYTTDKKRDWKQINSVKKEYVAGRTEDVYVEMGGEAWNGNLEGLRIDPVEGLGGSVEISLIELVGENGEILYNFDFSNPQNESGKEWEPNNVTVIENKGKLVLNIDVIDKKKEFSDPYIFCDGMSLMLDKAKYLHIRLRTDIEEEGLKTVLMQMFFKTKSSNNWNHEKCIPFRYEPGKDVDVYLEIRHLFWKGELVALRIDPFENHDGKTEFMLIELLPVLPDGKEVDLIENKSTPLENRFAKINEVKK